MGKLGGNGSAPTQLVVGVAVTAGDADGVGGVLRPQIDPRSGGVLGLGELQMSPQPLGGVGHGVGKLTDGGVPVQRIQIVGSQLLGRNAVLEVEGVGGGADNLPRTAAEGQRTKGRGCHDGGDQGQGDKVTAHPNKGQESRTQGAAPPVESSQSGAAGRDREIRGVRGVQKPHAGPLQDPPRQDRRGDENQQKKGEGRNTGQAGGQPPAPARQAVGKEPQRDPRAHGGKARQHELQG